MLVVFFAYWAFFTWLFTDNFIYKFAQYGYISICGSFTEVNHGCLIEDVVVSFPGFLAFIISFLFTTNVREQY
jgi:hypothetical protein